VTRWRYLHSRLRRIGCGGGDGGDGSEDCRALAGSGCLGLGY